MSSRRTFLANLAILAWLAAHPRPLPAAGVRSLRVASIVPPDRTEMLRGMAFGAMEAARSASLFGWSVAHLDAATGAGDGHADAFIVGTAAADPSTTKPVLRIGCGATVPDYASFHLNPCEPGRVAWRPDLTRYGAAQLNDRYRSATGFPMTEEAWLAWFAFKVVTESALRVASADAPELVKQLGNPATRFDGHKGTPLFFGPDRRLVQPLYEGDEPR